MLTRKTLLKIVAGQFVALSWCLGYIAAGGQTGPNSAKAVASHSQNTEGQIRSQTPQPAGIKHRRQVTKYVPATTAALPSMAGRQAKAVYPPMERQNAGKNRWRTGNTASFVSRRSRTMPDSVNPWRRYGQRQGALEYPPLEEYTGAPTVNDYGNSSYGVNQRGGYAPAEQTKPPMPPGFRYR